MHIMAADTDDTECSGRGPLHELCLDVIIRERFGETPACLSCGHSDLTQAGTTARTGAPVYHCNACAKQFNALSDTVFNRRQISLIEVCYILHEHDTRSAREIAQILNIGYEPVRRTIANLPDNPSVDPTVLQETLSEPELRAAAPNATTNGEEPEWDGLLKIRVLKPVHERLLAWEAAHDDCTHTEAIETLLDRVEPSSISVGPDDAPAVGTQDPEQRVTLSLRRNTKRRLKIWKELHGYTFHDAVAVLLDTVG
jgi:transposase-like protein